MKTSLLIITWTNRLLIIGFLYLIVNGFTVEKDNLISAAILVLVIGVFHIISALILPLIIKNNSSKSILITKYTNLVAIYLLLCFIYFIAVNFINLEIDFIIFLLMIIPVFLALFFTYLLEHFHKLKNTI